MSTFPSTFNMVFLDICKRSMEKIYVCIEARNFLLGENYTTYISTLVNILLKAYVPSKGSAPLTMRGNIPNDPLPNIFSLTGKRKNCDGLTVQHLFTRLPPKIKVC